MLTTDQRTLIKEQSYQSQISENGENQYML